MIETVLKWLLHCHHRRLSRPVAPIRKHGIAQGEPYVVCLDCGQQFAYDPQAMRLGRPLTRTLCHTVPSESLVLSRRHQ